MIQILSKIMTFKLFNKKILDSSKFKIENKKEDCSSS